MNQIADTLTQRWKKGRSSQTIQLDGRKLFSLSEAQGGVLMSALCNHQGPGPWN